MPSDANIYSMIRPQERQPGPLDNYGTMMQLRAMADQSELHGLQRKKLADDMAEEESFKAKIADWARAGGQGDVPPEAFAASPTRAAAMSKTVLEGRTKQAELLTKDRENMIAFAQEDRRILPTITDDAGWQKYLQLQVQRASALVTPQMRQVAMQHIGQAPANYNPDWIRSAVVKGEEAMAPKYEWKGDGEKEQLYQVNPMAGKVGVIEGSPTIDKKMTPEQKDASLRGWAQLNQPVWDEARGVYVSRPVAAPAGSAAAPSAAPGASPGVTKPANLPARPQDVHALRTEFNALPEVKQYRDTLPIVESARSAPDTRAGDIQMAYAVGKILDPNSVVREGELKLTGEAATVLQKLEGQLRTLTMGSGRLTPETRAELVSMLDSAVSNREKAYQAAETTYKGIAEKQGVPVDQVIIKPMARNEGQKPTAKPKQTTFDAMPDPAKYSRRRIEADDGTVYKSDGKKWVRQ